MVLMFAVFALVPNASHCLFIPFCPSCPSLHLLVSFVFGKELSRCFLLPIFYFTLYLYLISNIRETMQYPSCVSDLFDLKLYPQGASIYIGSVCSCYLSSFCSNFSQIYIIFYSFYLFCWTTSIDLTNCFYLLF